MLLRFGARNFYCFKEGIEISFELGANCPKSLSKNKKISNLICVKGANGSGKTSALKIISFIKYFCSDSFSLKPEDEIGIDSYFFNDDPIDLFCEAEIDGTKYRYEASVTAKKIISESLYRKKKKMIEVFQRKNNELSKCIDEFSDLKNIKLRSNASIISTAHQYQSNSIVKIYDFFQKMITNVISIGRVDLFANYNANARFYYNDKELFDFAKKVIKKCDPGISDINIHTRKNEEGSAIYYPVFKHAAKVNNNFLTYYSQSSGTRALFNVLPAYQHALKSGSVLILDEFDINFHPHILPFLVGIFDDETINKKNAQMIFTTHNTDIMDYMGKYRTILVNQEESESYGYRLDEISGDLIRNDRPIVPVYNAGKVGGVPNL